MTNKKPEEGVSTKLITLTRDVAAWVDANILPMVAIGLMGGLAVLGAMTKLHDINDQGKLISSIILVSLLAVKAFGHKLK